MSQPGGILRNNPGNLKANLTDKWQGLATPSSDNAFFVFDSAVYGIRAMARTLIAYQDHHDCKTVTDFITRYSPPSENDTASYIGFVSHYMEITPTAQIDVHQYAYMRPMIEAMIQQENGAVWSKYYTSDVIDKALVLAGVEPPQQSLITSGQVVGGTIAATATIAPTILDQLHQAQTQIQPIVGASHIFQYLFAALALAGIGYTIYSKYKERKKGIS